MVQYINNLRASFYMIKGENHVLIFSADVAVECSVTLNRNSWTNDVTIQHVDVLNYLIPSDLKVLNCVVGESSMTN